MMDGLIAVEEIAKEMRKIFECILMDSIQKKDTTGACIYASIILSVSINNFTTSQAKICGGGPDEDAGIKDLEGVLRGHYWVEGKTNDGTAFIADITADQFGYPAIVILSEHEGRERYIPGDDEAIQEHVNNELALCAKYALSYPNP
jgi:hypothetical protein